MKKKSGAAPDPVAAARSLGFEIAGEITTGGSPRRFFRTRRHGANYILIHDPDWFDYIALQRHLSRAGVAVPKVYDVIGELIIAEDLGRGSLKNRMKKYPAQAARYYSLAIAALVKFQIDGLAGAPVNRRYDRPHIRWEQDYFKTFFLKQLCREPDRAIAGIETDLDRLAADTAAACRLLKKCLMHRDFQSTNIFIKNNRARIIDFQSARIGPPSYDLASLLRDPYVNLPAALEKKLSGYYLRCLQEKTAIGREEFAAAYRVTAVQRHLQTLGAFANLALNKGKPFFLKFAVRAAALLQAALKPTPYERLRNFVAGVRMTAGRWRV